MLYIYTGDARVERRAPWEREEGLGVLKEQRPVILDFCLQTLLPPQAYPQTLDVGRFEGSYIVYQLHYAQYLLNLPVITRDCVLIFQVKKLSTETIRNLTKVAQPGLEARRPTHEPLFCAFAKIKQTRENYQGAEVHSQWKRQQRRQYELVDGLQ
jgi:hypothetical protein